MHPDDDLERDRLDAAITLRERVKHNRHLAAISGNFLVSSWDGKAP